MVTGLSNLYGGKSMSESEVKLEMKVKELEERILRIEKALITVPHTLNQGGSHPNDGGWFD
tara:strand:+ start:341 stop:523 length:183 start_codon:yes stop_codon:yes gene_type:complete